MSIDQSAIVFRRKISSFCDMKLAPLTDARQLRELSEYMTSLIDDRMPPPMLGRHVNWEEISLACGLGPDDEIKAFHALHRNVRLICGEKWMPDRYDYP